MAEIKACGAATSAHNWLVKGSRTCGGIWLTAVAGGWMDFFLDLKNFFQTISAFWILFEP